MAQTREYLGWSKERMNELSRTLRSLLAASGKNPTLVAKLGMVDRAYLIRLLEGDKTNPSLETLMRIWIGLVFDPAIIEREPDMIHGLARLVYAATMSAAPSKLAAVA